MKPVKMFVAAVLAASSALSAQEQEPSVAQAMPAVKQKEHAALEALAGTWNSVHRTVAMPGVPGLEEATETTATERATLLCDGLYLRSIVRGTWNGEPFEGVFLVGYDPYAKSYRGVWVGSSADEPAPSEWQGSYDDETGTWSWRGETAHGPMRSTIAFTDPDHSVETCFLTGPDGEEQKCMEVHRSRTAVAAAAARTDRSIVADVPEEQRIVLRDAGDWDATVEIATGPGAPPVVERGTERVVPLCRGRWVWSDFSGEMGGAPFTGHALYGFDPKTETYRSYWIDSMSPVWTSSTGEFDADTSTLTFEGRGKDGRGKDVTTREVIRYEGDDRRVLEMEMTGGEGAGKMTITYQRAKR